MKEQDLLNKYLAIELMVYPAVAFFLATRYWARLDESSQFYVVALLGTVVVARLVSAVGIRLAQQREAAAEGGSSYWLSFTGNLIAGLGWGVLPVLLYLMNIKGIPQDFMFPLANAGIAMLALVASGMMATSYLAYATPAFGLPLALSVHTEQLEMGLIWGFLFLISLVVANATHSISEMVSRYRKVGKGNKELYEKLMHSRDEALQAKRKVEQANVAIKAEIKERELAEARITASEQELNRILQDMIDTYFRIDNDGNICRISPSVQNMLGLHPETLLGQPFVTLFSDADELGQLQRTLVDRYGIAENVEVRLRHAYGDDVWASLNVHYYKDPNGQIAGFEGVARDVTESKTAAEALFQEKERLHVTLESIGDAVITTNTRYEVEYINPIGEGITGWSTAEAKGRELKEVLRLVDEEGGKPVGLPLDKWVKEGVRAALPEPAILCDKAGNGKSAIELNGAPIRDSENRVVGAVLVFHDVTKLRSLAKQLAYQATHDALTGLINRLEFDSRVQGALHSAQDKAISHALCYLDLDQFKVVNDTSGHHAGDELLKQITTLMRNQLRQSDTLARLGGDEFGLLLSGCDLERAEAIAEKVRAAVEAYRFVWEDNVYRVGASIGVVAINQSSGSLTELLSAADSACYVAKEHGRNRVHVYQQNDEAVAEHHGKMQWIQRIQSALEHDRFELHFQPITSLGEAEDEGRHGEVLLRMIDEAAAGTRLIPPSAFIPAAERYHLMPQIDQWVIRHTLEALAIDQGETADIDICAINLSGQSLGDMKLYDFIIEVLEETGVAPQQICFEITESAVVANIDVAKVFISKLHEYGCRFALDDFGSGLSSFEYLKELPVDYIKLDGSLIRDISKNHVSLAMARAINYITHVMGMKSIAEFVEDEPTVEALKSISVNYAQGYWLGKPRFFSKAVAQDAARH